MKKSIQLLLIFFLESFFKVFVFKKNLIVICFSLFSYLAQAGVACFHDPHSAATPNKPFERYFRDQTRFCPAEQVHVSASNNSTEYHKKKLLEMSLLTSSAFKPEEILGCLPALYHAKIAKKCVDLRRHSEGRNYFKALDLYVRALRLVENENFYEAKAAELAADIEIAKVIQIVAEEQEKETLIQEIEKEIGMRTTRSTSVRKYVAQKHSNGETLLERFYDRSYSKSQLKTILKNVQEKKAEEKEFLTASIIEEYNSPLCPATVKEFLTETMFLSVRQGGYLNPDLEFIKNKILKIKEASCCL